MKLKKIASLALAGIMAVSMLAGCGEGINNSNSGSSSSQPTSSGYAASILAKTNDAHKYMTAGSNTKIDDAIAAIAEKAVSPSASKQQNLTAFDLSGNTTYQNVATMVMTGAKYWDAFDASEIAQDETAAKNMLLNKKDVTVYSMYYVSKGVGDTVIDNMVVDALDKIVKDNIAGQTVADGDSYTYTVDIAKVDWKEAKDVAKDDAVIVGIAITVDYTGASY